MISPSPRCWSHEKIEHILLQQSEEKLLMKTDFFMITLSGRLSATIALSFGTDAYFKWLGEWSFFFILVPHLLRAVECNGSHEMG